MAVQFPGDGQIYVSAKIESFIKCFNFSYPTFNLDPLTSKVK